MGISKTHHFNEYQNQVAKIAKAFAHPARVAILECLIENKTCIVGDLTEILPLSQSTISQHLKELKNIGIIKGNIEGPSICYCIDENVWNELSAALKSLISKVNDSCC